MTRVLERTVRIRIRLTVNVSILLDDEIGDGGIDPEELTGDNVYTPCTTPQAGEGLFNQTELDLNNDGIADEVDTACGDLACDRSGKRDYQCGTIT